MEQSNDSLVITAIPEGFGQRDFRTLCLIERAGKLPALVQHLSKREGPRRLMAAITSVAE